MSEQANNKLTDERIAEISDDGFLEHGDAKKMATELQEYRNASREPVVWMNRFTGRTFELEQQPGADNDFDIYIPLYAAPPAPVSVPGELTREEYKRRFMEEDEFDDTFRGGWNACRAAMQGKAEPRNLPVIPDGWQLVPKELTPAMQSAWDSAPNGNDDDDENMRCAYRAMLAAASLPTGNKNDYGLTEALINTCVQMLGKALANAPLWPSDSQGKKRS